MFLLKIKVTQQIDVFSFAWHGVPGRFPVSINFVTNFSSSSIPSSLLPVNCLFLHLKPHLTHSNPNSLSSSFVPFPDSSLHSKTDLSSLSPNKRIVLTAGLLFSFLFSPRTRSPPRRLRDQQVWRIDFNKLPQQHLMPIQWQWPSWPRRDVHKQRTTNRELTGGRVVGFVSLCQSVNVLLPGDKTRTQINQWQEKEESPLVTRSVCDFRGSC